MLREGLSPELRGSTGEGGSAGGRHRHLGKAKALGIRKQPPEGLRPSTALTTAAGLGAGAGQRPHSEPGPPWRGRLGKRKAPQKSGVRGEGGPRVSRRL